MALSRGLSILQSGGMRRVPGGLVRHQVTGAGIRAAIGPLHQLSTPLLGPLRRGMGFFSSSRARQPSAATCTFADSRLLGFSPEQLFDVVADVAKYSDFVPFCSSSCVTKRGAPGDGSLYGSPFEADLAIEFFHVTERYTSRVTLNRPHHINAAAIHSKLFRTLSSDWRFKPGPTPQTCVLEFKIDFAVASPLYAPIIDHVLPEVTQQQVTAFTNRCIALYGRPQPLPV
ncbi:dehydrase and lipid transport-domain-containing protein [Pavlovales sp. CCMP2436]|nr:dehydrase and lipid transport-domain-containing protein [Pavlovales sp. CCMP2436]